MRTALFSALLLVCTKIFGLYLLVSEEKIPYDLQQRAYHEVLAREDYPVCLASSRLPPTQTEMDEKLKQIHPQLKSIWVPTSLFQLFVLHSYFCDEAFREYVQSLGYTCGFYDRNSPEETKKFEKFRNGNTVGKSNIDEEIVRTLSDPTKHLSDIFSLYEEMNQREKICTFFLKINHGFLKRYSRQLTSDLLKEIPREINAWQKSRFPFLFSYAPQENMELLLRLFSHHPEIIQTVIAEEWKAHEEGQHLLYRGAEVVFFQDRKNKTVPLLFLPVKAKNKGEIFTFEKEMSSFSLSYANSLFGGLFLSLDACAARYSQPITKKYVFHALKLDRNSLIEDPLFCIPPLHPFAEILADGEWFHPHTKIARKEGDPRCYGWAAEGNRIFTDRLGFLMRSDVTPQELGAKLLRLAAEHAILLHVTPCDLSLPIKNHTHPIQELLSN